MTKSQNTKNEQQKDLCITYDNIDSRGVWHWRNSGDKEITSEQLTEQWKKGELEKDRYYYVRDVTYILPAKLGKYDNQFYFSGNEVGYGYEENTELEVLAPVPSYEEWQASEKYNKHLEEVIKVYERKDKQATETSIAYNELLEENAQLLSEYEKECHRADELEDSYWKAEKENKELKEEVSRESYKVSEAYCCVEELKELLKEVNDYLPEFEMPMNILARIDEVLK